MLPGDLFTFTPPKIEGDLIKANVMLDAFHPIFQGHFPGRPVLPGVCMLQMVKQVAEIYIGKKISLKSAQHLKFLSVVYPVEDLMIQMKLKMNVEGDNILIAAELLDNAVVFFKFKGTFMLL